MAKSHNVIFTSRSEYRTLRPGTSSWPLGTRLRTCSTYPVRFHHPESNRSTCDCIHNQVGSSLMSHYLTAPPCVHLTCDSFHYSASAGFPIPGRMVISLFRLSCPSANPALTWPCDSFHILHLHTASSPAIYTASSPTLSLAQPVNCAVLIRV